uniref:ELKS/RAB6-interacting/CAST family member 2 n=1 Tax=Peromyscus maniculatus bairdii TaxID=230844 RepID=A0A8C8UQF4_PERMB
MAFNCSLQTCSSSRVPCEPGSERQICSHELHRRSQLQPEPAKTKALQTVIEMKGN